MNCILKNIFCLLLVIPSAYSQKSQIKEAQKAFKDGNSEKAIAILNPVEFLIVNAAIDDRINFYHFQGNTLVNLANSNVNTSENLSKAIMAFNYLIQAESESNNDKYTSEAIKSLHQIKNSLVNNANEDLKNENFSESSKKFYQAYLIDRKDTLQLYNAALAYNKSDDIEAALQCFEELKRINYSANTTVFVAYSKNLLKDEYFSTIVDRDAKIKSGTHLRPSKKIRSEKGEIYKNIALIYVKKGLKEKAIKAIAEAKNFDILDESLALIEANLYLETKDYETFDFLAQKILELNPGNAELASNFGVNCEKEFIQ